MSQAITRRTNVFVVKVWVEYLEQEYPSWRGEISHVADGSCSLFTDLDSMLEFIRANSLPNVTSHSTAAET